MRILRINDINVDIDEQTAIGIDLQCYDFKNPANRYVNVSNTFSIPKTANNLEIFGNPGSPYSLSNQVYESNYCNYWVNNWHIIDNARVKVTSISDRIELFVFEKPEIFDILKDVKWSDFVSDYLVWLYEIQQTPTVTHPYTGSISTFLDSYIDSTIHLFLPFFIGNLYNYKDEGQRQIETQTVTGTVPVYLFTPLYYTVTIGGVSNTYSVGKELTMELLAENIANDMVNHTFITDSFDVSLNGATITLTAKEPLANDNTINISIDSTDPGIDNKPSSINTKAGIEPGENYLEQFKDSFNLVSSGQIYLKHANADHNAEGGHFCIFIKSIFQYIEQTYNVNFLTSRVANIWADPIANSMFVPAREISVKIDKVNNECYFYIDPDSKFLPFNDQKDKADKTLYDLVMGFFQHLNIIKDNIEYNHKPAYKLNRLDLINTSEIVDWSDRQSGSYTFSPIIEGLNQTNYIKFKEIYPEGNSQSNAKEVYCYNENIDKKGDLITIDAYVCSVLESVNETKSILNMSDKESFKTFCFMVANGYTDQNILINYIDYRESMVNVQGWSKQMQVAQLYSLSSEYNVYQQIVARPKVYKIKKWLNITDIQDLQFFKRYYIKELGGCFFINKISGFNPEKSNEPTEIELIKVSEDTPWMGTEPNYFTDGIGDPFVDGINQYFS